jgi:hypothetical protein
MMQGSSDTAGFPLRQPRRFPRTSLNVHVDFQIGDARSLGRVVTISEGGLLILTRHTSPLDSELQLHFQLPNGVAVDALGQVRYTKAGTEMGVMFIQLPDEARQAIARHVAQVRPYARRSARLARQLNVVLRWRDLQGLDHEEAAVTMTLSRNGGLLACLNRFKPGQDFYLWWPEQDRGARARVVFRQLGRLGNLAEVGFEFSGVDDFWQIEFPPEARSW